MNFYGLNHIIPSYLGVSPKVYEKVCHSEHGWTPMETPATQDFNSKKPILLVWNRRRQSTFKKHIKKSIHVIRMPFFYFRKRQDLKIKKEAAGTVFYPAHSTALVDIRYDVEEMIKKLKDLSEEFHPITVCLYYLDLEKGLAKPYESAGFNIATAGNADSSDFPSKFYDILLSHRYACANSFGSASFYAIEAGLPFFMLSSRKPKEVISSDANVKGYSMPAVKKEAIALFTNDKGFNEITVQQHQFLLEESGVVGESNKFLLKGKIYFFYGILQIKELIKKVAHLLPPETYKKLRGLFK